jgi:hypothetical protein
VRRRCDAWEHDDDHGIAEVRVSVISFDAGGALRSAERRRVDEGVRRLAEASKRGEPLHDALAELDAARAAFDALENPKPDVVDELWQPIGAWHALTSSPPPRQWLLRRPNPETNGATSIGVLPLSKCGLLYGDGGVGKSWFLAQLALSVATGRRFLEVFDVAHTGGVLLAMGEEDQEELHRRLYSVARAMRLTAEQEQLAGARIVALPLAGRPTALVESDHGITTESAFMHGVRARLKSTVDWKLVVIDPLPRFAGADTEKDNAAATRFVQVVESLVDVPGRPSVLVSHHTRKPSNEAGRKSAPSAANARGASALPAGFRWAAELESFGDDGARFTVTKSNYAPRGTPVELVRDAASDGYLRAATRDEQRTTHEAIAARRKGLVESDAQLLASLLRTHPGLGTRDLRDVTKTELTWGVPRTNAALAQLELGIDGLRAVNLGNQRAASWSLQHAEGAPNE